MLVLWRPRGSSDDRSGDQLTRERLATRGIGLLLGLLGAGTAGGAALQLAARRHPDAALRGLLISLVSLAFMFVLWRQDAAAALVLGALIRREGLAMVRAWLNPAFEGACGCDR